MKTIAAKARTELFSLVEQVRASGGAIEIRQSDQPAAYLVDAAAFRRLRGIEDSVRAEQLRRALKGPMYDLGEILASIKIGL